MLKVFQKPFIILNPPLTQGSNECSTDFMKFNTKQQNSVSEVSVRLQMRLGNCSTELHLKNATS